LHFTCIHLVFLPCFSTHLTLPFIKTPDSWLFHITKICTLEYIIKNSRNNITIHFIIFWYYRKFTQRYKHRFQCKSLRFFVLLKTWIKITIESHVLLKTTKTTINMWYIKHNLWFSTSKFLQLLPLFHKTMCLRILSFACCFNWSVAPSIAQHSNASKQKKKNPMQPNDLPRRQTMFAKLMLSQVKQRKKKKS